MLLNTTHRRCFSQMLTLACLAAVACGFGESQSCYVELPTYDSGGNPFKTEIMSAVLEGDGTAQPKILDRVLSSRSLRTDRNRVYFNPSQRGRLVAIVLKSETGDELHARVELLSCQQRTSLRFGSRGTGADVDSTVIDGTLLGCRARQDWWIRAMPMFGSHDRLAIFEGKFSSDGIKFEVVGAMKGERHILVIGHANEPITAVGISVVEGGENLVKVDLSQHCHSKQTGGKR